MNDYGSVSEFEVGSLYTIEHIQSALGVGNSGGVRVSLGDDKRVRRAVVLTSELDAKQHRENPYHDRFEGDVLVYTGAGREGDQTLAGINRRIPQQLTCDFPIYGFTLIASRRDASVGPARWKFVGLLEYLRHYPETQYDARSQQRRVWIFELRRHQSPPKVGTANDGQVASALLADSRASYNPTPDEGVVMSNKHEETRESQRFSIAEIEKMRTKLLSLNPERFEYVIRDLLVQSGFTKVAVTRYSQDGGVDVNAYTSESMWPIKNTLVQVQAKRWLHTVGRKEVAELRGSLSPHARGTIVTTSYYSRAAILEASEEGKLPITLIDGHETAKLALSKSVNIS